MPSAPLHARQLPIQLGWILPVLLAAMLQVIVAWRSALVARDGLDFIRYAQRLPATGTELLRIQDQHPGYPLMVLGSSVLLRPLGLPEEAMWIHAARLPSMLGGLGCVVVVWLLARRLFDNWTAAIAALVCAAMPIFRQSAADALSDSPHLFFYLLAAWLVCEGLVRRSWPWFAGAGAASAAAYWIRPEGLAVSLVAEGTLLLVLLATRGNSWRQIVRCGGALFLATAVLSIPYPWLSGKLTSKQNPYAQQQPRAPFLINEAAAQAAATPEPVAAPAAPAQVAASGLTGRFLVKTLGRALYEFGDEVVRGFRYYFLIFYLLGYFELRKRSFDLPVMVFLYGLATLHIALLIGVFFMSGYISHRHLLPLIALAMPWIGLGILYTGHLAQRISRTSIPAGALAGGIAVVSVAIVVPRASRELHQVFLPTLEVAAWVRSNSQPEDRVLTNSKYVSYFSGRPSILLADRFPTVDEALLHADGEKNYRIAVLDLAEDGYRSEWLTQLTTPVPPLLRLEGNFRGRIQPRLLVLRGAAPRVAAAPTAGGGLPPGE